MGGIPGVVVVENCSKNWMGDLLGPPVDLVEAAVPGARGAAGPAILEVDELPTSQLQAANERMRRAAVDRI